MTDIRIDDAFEILSNPYRREILKLISIKDRYAFELSKLLNISQRAVKNHLDYLEDIELIISEKKKSVKGPDREYFKLNNAVSLSLTIAPNLFYSTIRTLDDDRISMGPISPALQLGVPQDALPNDVIKEGMQLIPQIKEGLDLILIQQGKLLRGYQGMRLHVSNLLEKNGFSSREVRIILLLIEKEGTATNTDLEEILGDMSAFQDSIRTLQKDKKLITTKYNANTGELIEMSLQI
ncbi:MAG: helix-turn-helix domain-containing protein [Candidatus Heimdallarchaeota archaeon]|nr:helix-turn-helix domain-containing protein [Candidatus Heimdallarchaeota archaeon]